MATSGVYIPVIQDVINQVRHDFVNNDGPGNDVLLQLQGLWEAKLMQACSILGPIERCRGTEEYQTPTTDLLFPLTPLPGSGQTHLPGTAQTLGTAEFYNIPTGGTPFTPGEYPSEIGGVSEVKPGRPMQFMIYNYQGVVTEDYNVVNTPAPELQAATTPAFTQNDVLDDDDDSDDDEESLNENDDDDDLGGVDQEEDRNISSVSV